jgi:hypothetical protein
MISQCLQQEFFPKQEEKFITKARKDEVTKNIFFSVFSNFDAFVKSPVHPSMPQGERMRSTVSI